VRIRTPLPSSCAEHSRHEVAEVGSVLSVILLLLAAPLHAAPATATAPATAGSFQVLERSQPPTVGTEGRLDVVLPIEDLVPVVAGSKSDVVVRVAERRQWGTGWRYDLRWIAAVPGRHDLTKYLRREGEPDAPVALAPLTVEANSVLPQSHDGSLGNVGNSPVGGIRWYWPVAVALLLAWAVLLEPLIRKRLRRKAAPPPAPPPRPPTLGERLRPLVVAATAGQLDVEGQGRLERLLLQVWRHRLGLGGLPVAQAVVQMMADPQAGQILRAVQDWLHRPPTDRRIDETEVTRLLAPYAQMPDVNEAWEPPGGFVEATA
jgi:hypothetical protein